MLKKILFFFILFFFIILFIKICLFLLPDNKIIEFEKLTKSVKFYDRNGYLIRYIPSLDGNWRVLIPYDKIPQRVIQTIIASEDKRFYYHFGVDPIAIIRSIYLNIKYKKIISGSSTITMQLSRLIYPHKNNFTGKIYEVFRAIQIESKKSKKWILEQYINNIPFGYATCGFGAGSLTYFNKELQELSEEEIAILSIIPRAPTKYNPFKNKEFIFNQTKKLLKKIDKQINEEKILYYISKVQMVKREFFAPHFINFLQKRLNKYFIEEKLNNIIEVKTTLDLSLQSKIENFANSIVDKYKNNRISNVAVLVLNNKNNEIISYLGSKDFFDFENSGQIDGVQIKNQPGSTLKPYLFALALNNGFYANTILPDIELNLGGEENYKPDNFNLRTNGPVRFRVALASSLNIPAVYLLNKIGVKNFINHLRLLGFESILESKDYPGVGLALGNSEVKLYELTKAFSVFANNGILKEPTGFKEFKFKNGDNEQFNYEKHINKKFINLFKNKQIYSKEVSFLIFDILQDNKSRSIGFGPLPFFNNKKIAIKTGTSSKFGNIWAIGSTKNFTIGVWAGNFNGNTIQGLSGSSLPLELINKIFEILPENNENINIPDTLQIIPICSLSGEKATDLCSSVIYEYIPLNISGNIPECTYHKKNQQTNEIYISYPAMFIHWAEKKGLLNKNQLNDIENNTPLILSPPDGSVFYIDPLHNKQNQGIFLKVSVKNGGKPLYYSLNNSKYMKLDYPYRIILNLNKGIYNLKVFSQDKKNFSETNFRIE